MKQKKIIYYIILYILFTNLNLYSYDPVFLRIPPFARPAGMAESFTSISDGTYGLYYNPAGMSKILSHEIQATYSLWMENIHYGYISGIFTEPFFGRIKIGSSYSMFEINRDSAPVDWSLYDINIQKVINKKFAIGMAMELFDIVSLGVCYKYNLSEIGNESFFNSTIDTGIILNFMMDEQMLRLSFLASGTGNKLIENNKGFFMPPNYLIGISDKIYTNWAQFIITTDVTFTPDLIALFKIGGELIFNNSIFIRGGYKIGAFNHFTYGAGFKLSQFELNYAFEEYETYKPSHMVSLLVNFGAPVVGLKIKPMTFSPNDDGVLDKVMILPEIREVARVISLEIKIYNEKEELLYSIPVKNKYVKIMEWDGKIDNKKLKDGIYFISLAAEYDNVGWTESSKVMIKIDTTPPEVKISSEPYIIRPDKKKFLLRPVTFHFSVRDLSGIDKWEFRIWSNDMKRKYFISGQGDVPESFVWDGKDNDGNYFNTKKTFFYKLTVYDIQGNKTETKPKNEQLISREFKVIHSSYAVFDKTKSFVKTSAYNELKKIKNILLKYPEADIIIAGHTDLIEDTGKYKTREELSIARANALKFFLRDILGFKNRYIIVEGYGATRPIADNKTEEGRKKNRRVELIIRAVVYK